MKEKSFKTVTIICIGAALLAAVVFCIIGIGIFASPKAKLVRGITNTFMEQKSSPAALLGLPGLKENLRSIPYGQSITVALDDVSKFRDILTFAPRITLDSRMDYSRAISSSDVSVLFGGSKILSGELYATADTLTLSCPEIYDAGMRVATPSLGKDFNASALSQILNLSADDTFGFRLFQSKLEGDTLAQVYQQRHPTDFKALYKAMEVSKKEKDVYEVTIPREDFAGFLQNLSLLLGERYGISDPEKQRLEDFLASLSQQDFTVIAVLDQKSGRFNKISYEEEALRLDWSQTIVEKSFTTDLICRSGTAYGERDFTISSTFDSGNNALSFDSSLSTGGVPAYALSFQGRLKDMVKGKSFALEVEALSLVLGKEDISITLSGEYALAPLEQTETVALPLNAHIEPLTMKKADLYGVGFAMVKNSAKTALGSLLKNIL